MTRLSVSFVSLCLLVTACGSDAVEADDMIDPTAGAASIAGARASAAA